jgi:hypothetical protein
LFNRPILPEHKTSSSAVRHSSETVGSEVSQKKVIRPQGKASGITGPNRLSITGGSIKGRKINSPSVHLRPMMAKVSFITKFYPEF